MNKLEVIIAALIAENAALKLREAYHRRAAFRARAREWMVVLVSLSTGAVICAVSMYLVRICP